MRPTMIFNPHGMPSRMTCAQLIESLLSTLCAIKGTHFDATMFKKVDIESIAEELSQYGYQRYGYRRMISGITGEYMDTLVFFGPTYYQRLQKFVADAEYSVRHALTDAVTLQPLDQPDRSKWHVKMLLVCSQQATHPNSGNILNSLKIQEEVISPKTTFERRCWLRGKLGGNGRI